jgi:hypothetical protein
MIQTGTHDREQNRRSSQQKQAAYLPPPFHLRPFSKRIRSGTAAIRR